MTNLHSVALKCGTTLDLSVVESAGISYLPCGQYNGQDQPLISFSHLLDTEQQFKLSQHPNKAWIMSKMTGIQILTGKPTNKLIGDVRHYLLDVDIEKHLIDTRPEIVNSIVDKYKSDANGNPFIVQTKSGGLRLSMYITKYPSKISYKHNDDMLLEMFSHKGYSRLDHRYSIREGIITEIPHMDLAFPQWVDSQMKPISTKQDAPKSVKVEDLRTIDGKVDFGKLEWNAKGISQSFPKSFCKATEHKHPDASGVQYLKIQGRIDGYCHSCKSQWTEVDATFPQARETTSVNNRFEVKEKQEAPPNEYPTFPNDVFYGSFQHLYDAYIGKGNYVLDTPFVMAMGLSAVGVISARMRYIIPFENSDTILFPNMYSLVVGTSTYASKSTTRKHLIRLINNAYDTTNNDNNVNFLTSLVSKQGLLAELDTDGWVDYFDGITALLHFDELKAMFANMRRDYATDVQSLLNTLWDCPVKEHNPAQSNKIDVYYPVMNIFGCSTRDWLNSSLIKDDLEGGFMNRFITFYSDGLDDYISKPVIHKQSYDKFLKALEVLTEEPVGRRAVKYILTDEAFQTWDNFCEHSYKEGRKKQDNVGTRRSKDHALKIALSLHIATEPNQLEIGFECMNTALTITEYLEQVGTFLYSDVVSTETAKAEQRILNRLNKFNNSLPRKEIVRSLRDLGTSEVGKIIDGLLKENVLFVNSETGNIEVQK